MPKCSDCRNRVTKTAPSHGLCYSCLYTPPEIRSREINGCLSLGFLQTPEQLAAHERKAEQQKALEILRHSSAKVNRSRLRIALKPPEPSR